MSKKFIAAVLLSAFASCASATTVNYTLTIQSAYQGVGQFTGIDSNTDGFLSLSELSDFSFDVDAIIHTGLAELSDFGRYDIAANTWLHDASGWGVTDFAYFSFDNGSSSVNTRNTTNVVTVLAQAPAEVPEPAGLALSALALLALRGARRNSK